MSITALSTADSASYWEEFFNLSNPAKNRQSGELSTSLFSELDADSDGKVSRKESGLSQQTFDALDTDQDGSVSPEELEKALQLLQQAAMLTRMKLGGELPQSGSSEATGGAGQAVSESGAVQSVFDSMDANQDGMVSAGEMAAALEKQAEAVNFGANSAHTGISGKAKDFLFSLASKAYSAITDSQAKERHINATA